MSSAKKTANKFCHSKTARFKSVPMCSLTNSPQPGPSHVHDVSPPESAMDTDVLASTSQAVAVEHVQVHSDLKMQRRQELRQKVKKCVEEERASKDAGRKELNRLFELQAQKDRSNIEKCLVTPTASPFRANFTPPRRASQLPCSPAPVPGPSQKKQLKVKHAVDMKNISVIKDATLLQLLDKAPDVEKSKISVATDASLLQRLANAPSVVTDNISAATGSLVPVACPSADIAMDTNNDTRVTRSYTRKQKQKDLL